MEPWKRAEVRLQQLHDEKLQWGHGDGAVEELQR